MSNTESQKALLAQARETFVKIDLLDINERVVGTMEGKVGSGSVSIDEDASVRRTLSLVFTSDEENYRILETANPISLNKRMRVFIGVKNYDVAHQPTSWFKIGVFAMLSVNNSISTSGRTITLQAQDKMCLHNGTLGGKVEVATRVDAETVDSNKSELVYDIQLKLKTSSAEAVKKEWEDISSSLKTLNVYFTSEDYLVSSTLESLIVRADAMAIAAGTITTIEYREKKKAFISDFSSISDTAKTEKLSIRDIIKYFATTYGEEKMGKILIDVPDKVKVAREIKVNNEIKHGFSLITPTIQEELILSAGQPITMVYDKCNEALGGNYEYFYDTDGNFIFQEKKNYLYQTMVDINDLRPENYKANYDRIGVEYDFSKTNIISSITNNPDWGNIKNDFYVYGNDSLNSEDVGAEICYHLTIDDKPYVPEYVFDYITGKQMDWREYVIHNYHVGVNNTFVGKGKISDLSLFPKNLQGPICLITGADVLHKYYAYEKSTDSWKEITSFGDRGEANRFYKECASKWFVDRFESNYMPKEKPEYRFHLDVIDGDADLSKFSVKTIGIRRESITDEGIKRLYQNPVEEILIYYKDEDLEYTTDPSAAIKIEGPDDFKSYPIASNIYKDAFSAIKQLMWTHTSFNEQVNVVCLPLYHLEVGRRNFIYSDEASVNGYFLSKKITYSLNDFGQMTINFIKAKTLQG